MQDLYRIFMSFGFGLVIGVLLMMFVGPTGFFVGFGIGVVGGWFRNSTNH